MNCPSCNSNLLGFKLIDNLEDKYIESHKKIVNLEGKVIQSDKEIEAITRKKNKTIGYLATALLLLIPLLLYVFWSKKETPPAPPIVEKVKLVESDSLDHYKQELQSAREALQHLQSTVNVRSINYQVEKGNTLHELGKLFFNDSLAGFQIAIDNKIFTPRKLPAGDTIKINYRYKEE